MKKLLLFAAFAVVSQISIAQQTYHIQFVGSNYSVIQINEAIANANLCGFYYISVRRDLNFDDGTIVELFGADELPSLESSCSTPYSEVNNSNVWRITSTGHLVRTIATTTSKQ